MTLDDFLTEWNNDSDRLLVHTSGSTGQPKPLWVEKRRMEASARITCNFLGLREGDAALLCMPLDYIAGKMMVVRALTCGLRLLSVEPSAHPFSSLECRVESLECRVESLEFPTGVPSALDRRAVANSKLSTLNSKLNKLSTLNSKLSTLNSKLSTLNSKLTLVAMVPLQVYHTLQVPEERERLRQVRHLLIGGGAIDEAMERELSNFPHAVWSTYGMTETLSHIALRRLNGPDRSDYYTPFDGVSVALNADGCLVISAPAVCAATLVTNDRAELHADGRRFRIMGRKDNVVCSGGIKLQIEELERQLRPHIDVPFMVTKRKDPSLGEAVVLLVEDRDRGKYEVLCRSVLSRYERPKQVISVGRLPLTATGKPARKEAEELANRSECR